ncbi:MAG: hypothetical protein NTV19_12705 [Burkholderiales bacterium]|nr:hypothetical protein [Burkholderiales bacterium]
MLAAKLALVALSMMAAAWAAGRFGHRIAGLVSGFPMIVGPLIGLLLIDLSAARVAAICLATLANLPACIAHIVTFAWVSQWLGWWQSLLAASGAFFLASALIQNLPLAPWMLVALGLLVVALGPRCLPPSPDFAGGVRIPPIELACRIVAALAMAAAVIELAADAPAAISAMLMTFPITGSILPAFTRALYGVPATRALLRGFATGLHGLAVFFLATALALPVLDKWGGYALGVGCAVAYAVWMWWRARRRVVPASR